MITPKDNGYFKNFQGHDRFDVPEPVYRVTAGMGGEAYLIVGNDKAALHDTGMACFHRELISNIHEVLDPMGKTLDYVFVSHSHYDHIGALPYVLEEWPDAVVCGAEKCASVFSSKGARWTMADLGNKARILYGADCGEITAEGMRLDRALQEGETVDLGGVSVEFFEAKGHTDCSALYMVLPKKILFANESMAQVKGPGVISTSPLKSFAQTIESTKKAAALEPELIIGMHYGLIPKEYNEQFFRDYIEEAEWERDMIVKGLKNGLTDQEISDIHDKIYWNENRSLNQPYDAYHLNTMIIIRRVRKAVEEGRTDY